MVEEEEVGEGNKNKDEKKYLTEEGWTRRVGGGGIEVEVGGGGE